MSISGNFDTMPLPELFQWAGRNKKTGILRISHGRSTIQFVFEGGRLVGCSSNDPPTLLGQVLLSRGKIDEATLQKGLTEQESTGENLGAILVGMGVLAREELDRHLVAKAEDTVFKLFEWRQADFEFETAIRPDPNMVRFDIDVEELLLRGAKRQDELDRMNDVFNDPGIVLCRTDRELKLDTNNHPTAQRIYDLVDGRRTFAEILLRSRASRFLATKFLFQLHRRGIVTIKDVHKVAPDPGTPEAVCKMAVGLMSRGEHEAAVDLLHACSREHPRNEALQKTVIKVEAAYLDHAYNSDVQPGKVAAFLKSAKQSLETIELTSNELFVLGLVRDNEWDVKSLANIAPLHEIEVIRALRGLKTKGVIELNDVAKPDESELADLAPAGLDDPQIELNIEIDKTLEGIMDARTGR